LHVEPFNPESTKGKELQKEIQKIIGFEITEMRNFKLKNHEVYISLELMRKKENLKIVKHFTEEQYKRITTEK
jgi:hypothetical protein